MPSARTTSAARPESPGLVLLENLNYIKSYHRTHENQEAPPEGPRVTITNFDGPRPVTVHEPIWNGSSVQTLVATNYTEDGSRSERTRSEAPLRK